MKARNMLIGAALVVSTAVITSQVISQDKKPGAGQPPPSPEMLEMHQKMMEAGTPGENHKLLATKVGKWNGVTKMWMTPDMPPADGTCTSEVKPVMGGRYFAESVEGTDMASR